MKKLAEKMKKYQFLFEELVKAADVQFVWFADLVCDLAQSRQMQVARQFFVDLLALILRSHLQGLVRYRRGHRPTVADPGLGEVARRGAQSGGQDP